MSLIAQQVSLSSHGEIRLQEVSCVVPPGKLSVIIGPNGSGKSSLIKVLAGQLPPTEGQVTLDEKALHHWPNQVLARRRAVLPQQATLDFPFRVSDVVALGRSPYPRDRQNDRRLVEDAMCCFDIAKLADRMYTTLSGGERQRVHLARVWIQLREPGHDLPCYLLLDEPSAALDLKHQRDLLDLLKSAVRDGRFGVLAALHDLNSAAQYADQLILLHKGAIVNSGAPEQVMTTHDIQNVYQIPIEFLRYKSGKKQIIALPHTET